MRRYRGSGCPRSSQATGKPFSPLRCHHEAPAAGRWPSCRPSEGGGRREWVSSDRPTRSRARQSSVVSGGASCGDWSLRKSGGPPCLSPGCKSGNRCLRRCLSTRLGRSRPRPLARRLRAASPASSSSARPARTPRVRSWPGRALRRPLALLRGRALAGPLGLLGLPLKEGEVVAQVAEHRGVGAHADEEVVRLDRAPLYRHRGREDAEAHADLHAASWVLRRARPPNWVSPRSQ
jgi:hypothetical protein